MYIYKFSINFLYIYIFYFLASTHYVSYEKYLMYNESLLKKTIKLERYIILIINLKFIVFSI